MQPHVTPLERAFELAKSGRMATIDDIKKSLKREGYSTDQLTGRGLSKQLSALIRNAASREQTAA
jgi:hypothetical protein